MVALSLFLTAAGLQGRRFAALAPLLVVGRVGKGRLLIRSVLNITKGK